MDFEPLEERGSVCQSLYVRWDECRAAKPQRPASEMFSETDFVPPKTHEGYLLKQGEKGLVRTWKLRYFRLSEDGSKLSYFKHRESTESEKIGHIPLDASTEITAIRAVDRERAGRPHGRVRTEFRLLTPNRVFRLKTVGGSPVDQEAWLNALRAVVHTHVVDSVASLPDDPQRWRSHSTPDVIAVVAKGDDDGSSETLVLSHPENGEGDVHPGSHRITESNAKSEPRMKTINTLMRTPAVEVTGKSERPRSSLATTSSSVDASDLSSTSFSYRSPFAGSVEDRTPSPRTDSELTARSLADTSPIHPNHRSSDTDTSSRFTEEEEFDSEIIEDSPIRSAQKGHMNGSAPSSSTLSSSSSSSSSSALSTVPRSQLVRNAQRPANSVAVGQEEAVVLSAEAHRRLAELLKQLDASVAEIRAYFQCARSAAEQSRLGNDRLNPKVASLVRGGLCSVLASIFSDGFRVSKRKRQDHIWNFVEKISTKAAKGCTDEEADFFEMVSLISSDHQMCGNKNNMFRSFVVAALNQVKLHSWCELMTSQYPELLRRFYAPESILRSHRLAILSRLLQLEQWPFHLDVQYEFRVPK